MSRMTFYRIYDIALQCKDEKFLLDLIERGDEELIAAISFNPYATIAVLERVIEKTQNQYARERAQKRIEYKKYH